MYRMCVCVMLPRQISASSPRSPPVAPWNTAPCPTAAGVMAMAGVAPYEGAAVPAAPVTAPAASSASCNHLKTDLISTEQVWFFEVKGQACVFFCGFS